mmetsp:Transcript_2186/g.8687  ORF Transcript_2186/g.8687 Transcript_2186/m.8687 type:complete len:353 (-) Transcript_2186:4165-5223(-)
MLICDSPSGHAQAVASTWTLFYCDCMLRVALLIGGVRGIQLAQVCTQIAALAACYPERLYTLALDIHAPSFLQRQPRRLLSKCCRAGVAGGQTLGEPMALAAARSVHGITIHRKLELVASQEPPNNRPAVKAGANFQRAQLRSRFVHQRVGGLLYRCQRKRRHARGVRTPLFLCQPPGYHVAIANGLQLEEVKLSHERVEAAVEPVEHVGHQFGVTKLVAQVREVHDVAKKYRHHLVSQRANLLTAREPCCHVGWQHALQQHGSPRVGCGIEEIGLSKCAALALERVNGGIAFHQRRPAIRIRQETVLDELNDRRRRRLTHFMRDGRAKLCLGGAYSLQNLTRAHVILVGVR